MLTSISIVVNIHKQNNITPHKLDISIPTKTISLVRTHEFKSKTLKIEHMHFLPSNYRNKNLGLFSVLNHLPIGTSYNGDVKHLKCQPCEH